MDLERIWYKGLGARMDARIQRGKERVEELEKAIALFAQAEKLFEVGQAQFAEAKLCDQETIAGLEKCKSLLQSAVDNMIKAKELGETGKLITKAQEHNKAKFRLVDVLVETEFKAFKLVYEV